MKAVNKFEQADKYGQQLIKPTLQKMFGSCTLIFDEERETTDKCDLYFTAVTNTQQVSYRVECKHRSYPSTQFEYWFLEKNKHDKLQDEYKKGNRTYYLNSFSDGKLAIWQIGGKRYEDWFYQSLPWHSVKDDGKKQKLIHNLSLQDAVVVCNIIN